MVDFDTKMWFNQYGMEEVNIITVGVDVTTTLQNNKDFCRIICGAQEYEKDEQRKSQDKKLLCEWGEFRHATSLAEITMWQFPTIY